MSGEWGMLEAYNGLGAYYGASSGFMIMLDAYHGTGTGSMNMLVRVCNTMSYFVTITSDQDKL